MILSKSGKRLIEHYKTMAKDGFLREDGTKNEDAYNAFQLKKFRTIVLPKFKELNIGTVLDYGGGGSNWDKLNFDKESGQSAKQFFGVGKVTTFEPARNQNEKKKSDCVVCMDVLEHIFLADVSNVVRELFSLTKKLLIINVACYEAAALLPTGENAHITIRNPKWWDGLITSISSDFPDVNVILICSETFESGTIYLPFKSSDWGNSEKFTIEENCVTFGAKKVRNWTVEEIYGAVDLLTKKHPKTVTEIQKILKKNAPFMNPGFFS